MAGSGGLRPGAGRPKGAKSILTKAFAGKILVDCDAPTEFQNLLKSKNEKIKLETLKYLCDHLWGKAPQSTILSNPDGSAILAGVKVIYVE